MGKEVGRPTWNPVRGRLCFALTILVLVFLLTLILVSDRQPGKEGGKGTKYYMSMQDLNPLRYFNFNQSLDVDYIQNNLDQLDQMNPRLIEYTRVRYLSPPSKLPYNLELEGTTDYKDEFSAWVANFFNNQRGGVFIEAGAHEGEKGSHTLYLEKELGWSGLLVECNPTVVPYLKSHHRKAWVAEVCLAPTTTPGIVNFSNPTNWTYSGTFNKPWNLPVPTTWTFFDVQTMPLYTILAALGWTEVDYFSFDIEGLELAVLKTFPFHLFTFKVLIIEVFFITEEETRELNELLLSNDYQFVRQMQIDKIYVHNSVKHMIPDE